MAGKIKVIYINYSLGVGGIETLILELSKRLNREKFSPLVCSFEKDGALQNEFKEAGVPVYTVEKGAGTDWSLPGRLARLVRGTDADILHTHNATPWFYGVPAAMMSARPLVHTEHTTADYFQYHQRRWMFIEWLLSKCTRQITTVAESVAEFMVKRQKISPSKITVVHNGIDESLYDVQVDRGEKRSQLGLGDDDIVIGNVARFYPNKDHRNLIKAFKLAAARAPRVKLLLIGDGPLRSEVSGMVTELGIEGQVVFAGNRRDIPQLLKIIDVFALSSLREGFPIVLLEAMASNLPVVATDVDGNSELVKNGHTGILVPAADPAALCAGILKAIGDRQASGRMAQNGRKLVREEFTFERMVNKYEALYERIAASS